MTSSAFNQDEWEKTVSSAKEIIKKLNENYPSVSTVCYEKQANYPASYYSLGAVQVKKAVNKDTPSSIIKAIAIFQDYYKKNFFPLHHRHHNDIAKRIQHQLENIVLASPEEKLARAIEIIEKEDRLLQSQLKRHYNSANSSMVRRMNFVLKILREELDALEWKKLSKSMG